MDSSLAVLTEESLPKKTSAYGQMTAVCSSTWQPGAFSIFMNSQIQRVILITLPLQLLARQQVTYSQLHPRPAPCC